MKQTIKETRKSCQDNVNQLGHTYRAMYDEIEKKLRKDIRAGEALESALLDFSSMLLEAEAAGLTKDEVFPEGLERFYQELTEALPVITKEARKQNKRRIGIVTVSLIAALVMLALGSKHTKLWSDTYVEGQDHPYMYQTYMGIATSYIKGSHDYYFMRGKFLYRFDPETKKVSPLCTQEDCLHSREVDSNRYNRCYANVVGDSFGVETLGYWDGYVYYMGSHDYGSYLTLNRVKEDGSVGETVLDRIRRDIEPEQWTIHRGYLYFIEEVRCEEENKKCTEYSIKRLSLDDPEKEEMIYQVVREGEDRIANTTFFNSFTAYGNHLYFVKTDINGEERSMEIIECDLRSKKSKEIALPIECQDYSFAELVIVNGHLVIQAHSDMTGLSDGNKAFTANLDGSNLKEIELKEKGILYTDGQLLYLLRGEENKADPEGPNTVILSVCDDNGNILVTYDLPEGFYDLNTCFGDESGLLWIDSSNECKMWDIYWIDKEHILRETGETFRVDPVDEMRYSYEYIEYLKMWDE